MRRGVEQHSSSVLFGSLKQIIAQLIGILAHTFTSVFANGFTACFILLPPYFVHLASVISTSTCSYLCASLNTSFLHRCDRQTPYRPQSPQPPHLMSSDKCKGVLVNHHMVYKLNKRGLPASARRLGRTSKLLTKQGGPQRRNFDDVINRGEDKVPSQQKITGPPPHPQPEIPDPREFAANYPSPIVRKRDRRDAA